MFNIDCYIISLEFQFIGIKVQYNKASQASKIHFVNLRLSKTKLLRHVEGSGVTLPVGTLRSVANCAPPPIIFCVLKKINKKRSGTFGAPYSFLRLSGAKVVPQKMFHVDQMLNWTGEYTNKVFFSVKGPKFRKIRNFKDVSLQP